MAYKFWVVYFIINIWRQFKKAFNISHSKNIWNWTNNLISHKFFTKKQLWMTLFILHLIWNRMHITLIWLIKTMITNSIDETLSWFMVRIFERKITDQIEWFGYFVFFHQIPDPFKVMIAAKPIYWCEKIIKMNLWYD